MPKARHSWSIISSNAAAIWSRRQGRVGRRIGDAEAATQVQLREFDAGRSAELRRQTHGVPDGDLETMRLEDLGPDVAVDAAQVQELRTVATHQCGQRLTAHDRQAELLVLVGGGDVLVRVGLDAGGDAHHDLGGGPALVAGPLEPRNLVEGVDDDASHSLVQSEGDFLLRLVVAMEAQPLGRHSPASAIRISPIVVTSRLSPSSIAQRATVLVSNALPA